MLNCSFIKSRKYRRLAANHTHLFADILYITNRYEAEVFGSEHSGLPSGFDIELFAGIPYQLNVQYC